MAQTRKYEVVTTMRLFKNDDGKAIYSNSKWTPYKQGNPADIHFRGDKVYSVRGFQNDDGSIGVQISEIVEGQAGTDSITDGVTQGGLRPIAQSVQQTHAPSAIGLDDDIPF